MGVRFLIARSAVVAPGSLPRWHTFDPSFDGAFQNCNTLHPTLFCFAVMELRLHRSSAEQRGTTLLVACGRPAEMLSVAVLALPTPTQGVATDGNPQMGRQLCCGFGLPLRAWR